MRIVRYDTDRLGLLTERGDGIIDVTDRLGLTSADPLIEYLRSDADIGQFQDATPDVKRSEVMVETPIRWPRKVIAAPSNYAEHIAEMSGSDIRPLSYFLKSPSSIIGPNEPIELPFSDRRFDHEIELAFVMENDVKDIDRSDVFDAVFGFTILLDISMRGDEDRSNRKSYDSFTVVGPLVVTTDEIDDHTDLDLHLQVNGETRQQANTQHMIYSCSEIVEFASVSTTISAGDIVTTGTPSGVGPLQEGDVLDAEISEVGSMSIDVTQRDVRYEDVQIHNG